MANFTATIQKIKYSSGDFHVLSILLPNGKEVTASGTIFGMSLSEGSPLSFQGEWSVHPKYGKQIKILRAPLIDKTESIIPLLLSHGVSEEIVETLQQNQVSDFSQSNLEKILDPKDAEYVAERAKRVTGVFKSTEVLESLGVSNYTISKIFSQFQGDLLIEVLTENPWLLVTIPTISFEVADSFSSHLGLDPNSNLRIQGAILVSLRETKTSGSLYVGTGNISSSVKKLLKKEVSASDLGKALKCLHDNGFIVLDKVTDFVAIYEPFDHKIEKSSAEILLKRLQKATVPHYAESRIALLEGKTKREKVEFFVKNLSTDQFSLSPKQIEATVNAVLEPVSIITGGPGSGKTTTVKRIVSALRELGVSFSLVAPTGIAAKRLSSVSGVPASTIHKQFDASGKSRSKNSSYEGVIGSTSKTRESGEGSQWGVNENNPLEVDLLIIDEGSMVDQHMFFRALSGTKENCRIVIVGDVDQLPSVGSGNVLSDLIRSKKFSTVFLDEIFRQANTSEIVFVAHDITHGVIPNDELLQRDFVFIEEDDESKILQKVLDSVQDCLKRKEAFQVMSPRHAGTLGVTNLNGEIRSLLNPRKKNKKELKFGEDVVREDDRIMILQNDYSLDVFNGDTGKVNFISDSRSEVEVKLHEDPPRNIVLKLDEARKLLRLAYANTIHKNQGQEYDVVIIPWVNGFRNQLKRSLLYTGVTRAKKRVIMIGHKGAFEKAILDEKMESRNTLLCERLNKDS